MQVTKATITIDMMNEAFTDAPEIELARILEKLALKIKSGGDPGGEIRLFDVNGNRVGEYICE